MLRLWRFEGTWLDFEAAAVSGPDAGQQVFQEGASAEQMAVSEMDATGTGQQEAGTHEDPAAALEPVRSEQQPLSSRLRH